MAASGLLAETFEPLAAPLRQARAVVSFSVRAVAKAPMAIRYRAALVAQMSDITVGVGGLIVGAGAVLVLVFFTFIIGAEVSLQGVQGLQLIGVQSLIGFVSAYANVRELAPLAAGIIFAAQIGSNFTSELGAMRISEEIDALEVMSVDSMAYLVGTRLVAAYLTVLPLYVVGLYVQLFATKFTSIFYSHIPAGLYAQYFNQFLPIIDIFYSVVKVLVFITVVVLVHCAYGFNVRGGPEDVGRAVGRSVRLSVTLIFLLDFALTLVMFGTSAGVNFAG